MLGSANLNSGHCDNCHPQSYKLVLTCGPYTLSENKRQSPKQRWHGLQQNLKGTRHCLTK